MFTWRCDKCYKLVICSGEMHGMELATLVNGVRVRDCVLVVVCAFAIYLLRARNHFELQPSWRSYVDSRTVYVNGRYPSRNERLPRPILTDLDGDGDMEVVLVTGSLELQVCVLPQLDDHVSARQLPNLVVLESVELVINRDETDSHRPVVLDTGYILPAIAEHQQRTQVSFIAGGIRFVTIPEMHHAVATSFSLLTTDRINLCTKRHTGLYPILVVLRYTDAGRKPYD